MNRLTANTRTVVKSNYALITEDSYVNSVIPGWENATIRVVISPTMGANLSQYLIHLNPTSKLQGTTKKSQLFFYVTEGTCTIKIGEQTEKLKQGGYVYLPINQSYKITGQNAQLLVFQKIYEPLKDQPLPTTLFGNSHQVVKSLYLEDPLLQMQYLLPDNRSMDFAVNIFTYQPGGHLPFVETHVMEHGLLYLQGQGIYRLDNDWHHVTKGDVIWMAPYCAQWFTAMGKEAAVYIYCKDVNRMVMEE